METKESRVEGPAAKDMRGIKPGPGAVGQPENVAAASSWHDSPRSRRDPHWFGSEGRPPPLRRSTPGPVYSNTHLTQLIYNTCSQIFSFRPNFFKALVHDLHTLNTT